MYYPNLSKDEFIPDYLARKSGHSRGSTIDLTLIPFHEDIHDIEVTINHLNNGQKILYLDDGS